MAERRRRNARNEQPDEQAPEEVEAQEEAMESFETPEPENAQREAAETAEVARNEAEQGAPQAEADDFEASLAADDETPAETVEPMAEVIEPVAESPIEAAVDETERLIVEQAMANVRADIEQIAETDEASDQANEASLALRQEEPDGPEAAPMMATPIEPVAEPTPVTNGATNGAPKTAPAPARSGASKDAQVRELQPEVVDLILQAFGPNSYVARTRKPAQLVEQFRTAKRTFDGFLRDLIDEEVRAYQARPENAQDDEATNAGRFGTEIRQRLHHASRRRRELLRSTGIARGGSPNDPPPPASLAGAPGEGLDADRQRDSDQGAEAAPVGARR